MLGKAVPAGGDQAGLLTQLPRRRRPRGPTSADWSAASGGSSAAARSGDQTDPERRGWHADNAARPPSSTDPTRAATEASAATLPLGATVGPAGLAVMPFALTFSGDFFEIADFLAASTDGRSEGQGRRRRPPGDRRRVHRDPEEKGETSDVDSRSRRTCSPLPSASPPLTATPARRAAAGPPPPPPPRPRRRHEAPTLSSAPPAKPQAPPPRRTSTPRSTQRTSTATCATGA